MEKFWANVATKGPDECWLWTAGIRTGGYGGFRLSGKRELAHRVAYALTHDIPLDAIDTVCHSCDTPACCNPQHLVHGTQAFNMADKTRKRRGNAPKGDSHPNRKLGSFDVWRIKQRLTSGEAHKVIAENFHVKIGTIRDIALERTWRHITLSRIPRA